MFAIQHCIEHACVMNGSNHRPESDRTPMHPCASGLEKHLVVRIPLVQRDRELQTFHAEHGLAADAVWIEGHLASAPVAT